ncbi:N-acetyltransferase [Dysgonomonas sp. 521]|uniref:GNAT family N-acetyltransferase n=1 Tax=Dysgonomonas sp. 521 TaxID=2302932 RepID=UPI0013D3B48C|nr:GNAT family N-acetyltransferase [Dysgonomonas sp. 521]NDV96229.1 N-acetyltransferase [Dysgonomonas sp. 521]
MNLIYQDNCENIPWEKVPSLLKRVGMGFADAATHKVSFNASYSVIFVFDDAELIGFGRIISDGVRQSAIYDIAVEPAYQGRRIGWEIVKRLMDTTPDCNFILYASPGKEAFYQKFGFKKMRTGMVLFSNPERMTDTDFIEE